MSEYKRKCSNGKSVAEHILIAEKMIGRKLLKDEIVHHKNRNKKDNNISNLEVITKSNHSKEHAKDRTLVARGIIKCDYHKKKDRGYKYCLKCTENKIG